LKTRDVAILCGVLAVPAPAASQQPPGRVVRWAHVTYLTTASAYIDAGVAEGLRDTSRVEVIRGDTTVAVLAVTFLATHRAACAISATTATLVVGDSVRFTAAAPAPDSTGPVAARLAAPPQRPWDQRLRNALRGRLGLSFLLVRPGDGSGAQVMQPSGEFRMFGSGLGGTGLGIAADVRSRRSLETRADGLGSASRALTRVYQAALTWQAPASPLRLTAGRQYAPGIAPVGLVDGVSAQLDRSGWGGGVFVGSEPEPVNLGFSGTTGQLGAYAQRRSGVASLARWGVSAGLSGSYVHGQANREFLYLQGDYATRRVSIFAAQEVDYYRPWRRVGGESAVSPTSTFATLQLHVSDAISLTTGVDSRRNVRLYRDVVSAETAFDDAFRRGAWAGLSARAGRFQAAIDARRSGGGRSGAAGSTTLSLGADRIALYGLSLRSRSTHYTSPGRSGWLQSLTVGIEPGGRGSVQLGGGFRTERAGAAGSTTTHWFSADADVNLAGAWLMVLSAYREQGASSGYDLLYAGLSLRF
jgi:hypothetical protein